MARSFSIRPKIVRIIEKKGKARKKNRFFVLKCVICGTIYERIEGHIGPCCSRKCANIAMRNRAPNQKGVKTAPRINLICKVCGKEFEIRKKAYEYSLARGCKPKYCSRKCCDQDKVGKYSNNPPTGQSRNCQHCGKEFYAKVYELKAGLGKFCSHKCYTEYVRINGLRAGNNSPLWIEGLEREYSLEFNEHLKMRIRQRDQFLCQMCLKPEQEAGTLCVHHIDYNKKNNDYENLIALCPSCHGITNFQRSDWTRVLQEQLKNKDLPKRLKIIQLCLFGENF